MRFLSVRNPPRLLPLANRASPTIFDLRRGELVFFRRFPVFFEQNPTLNRKKSFRCAKRASFFFFFGPKKVFFLLAPRNRGATSLFAGQTSKCKTTRPLGVTHSHPKPRQLRCRGGLGRNSEGVLKPFRPGVPR